MEKTKINKGRMYHSSDLVLEKFSGLFADHAGLNQAHRQLKSGISMIDEEQKLQVADSKGLTENKELLRGGLTRVMLKFSLALKSLATMQQNMELLVKVSFRITDLNRLPDPILVDVSRMLQEQANPRREELIKFFVTKDDFEQLETLLAGFKGAIPQKRLAVTVSKSSTHKIGEVFESLDRLLKTEIDVYVAPFQFQHPDFYSEYCNARIIVGYTGRGSGKDGQEMLNQTAAIA
ncbi:MAG: hypothetical protein M0Q53_19220 [Prolixibacteraceae bacterium]|jgi:hypothetical protein|nr:hypothetical protein [Prolixibacteraceae bacterium]